MEIKGWLYTSTRQNALERVASEFSVCSRFLYTAHGIHEGRRLWKVGAAKSQHRREQAAIIHTHSVYSPPPPPFPSRASSSSPRSPSKSMGKGNPHRRPAPARRVPNNCQSQSLVWGVVLQSLFEPIYAVCILTSVHLYGPTLPVFSSSSPSNANSDTQA